MDNATQLSIAALKRLRHERKHSADGNIASPAHSPTRTNHRGSIVWPEPKPLPNGLLAVEPFSSEFMPEALAPWIDDNANRLQCPPEYVGVPAVTALGSVIGRRIGIKPQMKTDWIEFANLWGMFIGRPGMLKSPAMSVALQPIHHLEAEAAKENEVARQAYAAGLNAYALKKQVKASLEKEALKKGQDAKLDFDLGDEPKEPAPVRYRTSDSTYEAIGELLIANPAGILVERDELVSLLKYLDRDEQSAARGFYLSGWSGSQPYTFDRIARGHRHIDAVCVSVLGNTQPSRIAEYVRRANADGGGGDGLLQRFGLLVWPDCPIGWRDVDKQPDSRARQTAWEAFTRLSALDQFGAVKLGALKGDFDKAPYLRFDEEAHAEFLAWHSELEMRLRSGELSPALEGHLAKYRKLVPALALITHLADNGQGAIPRSALLKALAFAAYLESHAKRVYGSFNAVELTAGKAILGRLRKGDLADGFTARDIHRRGWSNLTDRDHIQAGLEMLVDLDYLATVLAAAGERGGRPKFSYLINPRGLA